jgi:hypothetical protein
MVLAAACGHGTQPPLPSLGEPARGRLALLDGRLSFVPPDRAVVKSAAHGLMSAPASPDEAMRIVLVPGEERARFVMMVLEEFATLKPKPAARDAQIAAWFGDEIVSAEVRLDDGGVATEYVPRGVDDIPALMIYGAVVEASDHTVISIEFYINRDDASARDRIATPGTITVDLPPAIVLTQQRGHDFTVYSLRPLVKLGSWPAKVGIYVGWPTFQHQQQHVPESKMATEVGILLGKEILWHIWAENNVVLREAILTGGDHDSVHVWSVISGDDPKASSSRPQLWPSSSRALSRATAAFAMRRAGSLFPTARCEAGNVGATSWSPNPSAAAMTCSSTLQPQTRTLQRFEPTWTRSSA